MRPEVLDNALPLQVISCPADATAWTKARIAAGRRVAFVPTMGALHEGHLALVRRALSLADEVVVSIFVNPTQFGPSEDFSRYPRTFQRDIELLSAQGAAMVFAPSADDMYAERFSTSISPPAVAAPLEGLFRPGHFSGVCTVVLKLFQIVPAQVAVFGQKDFQQARVIQDMVADLNLDITIDVLATVRESDGLAMSSRNRYLSPTDRKRALGLSTALNRVFELHQNGKSDAASLEQEMRQVLEQTPVDSIDYAGIVDPVTLLSLQSPLPPAARSTATDQLAGIKPVAVALIAAHISGTRLIDNRLLFASE
ncbi:MAG TPA: pantoate--beta-alanine ligase [Planctomycetaceae bacterium]|nr:pantoate--beta-alanine ligase [Planctomycetaceae bacterium]